MIKVNYKLIDDPILLVFLKKNVGKELRKQLGIKLPWFGEHKSKALIPYATYPTVSFLFVSFSGSGFQVGGKTKLDVFEPEIDT